MADGAEREALFLQAKRIAAVYVPYQALVHRLYTDMGQANARRASKLLGYRRPVFWLDFWQYVDVDNSKRPKP